MFNSIVQARGAVTFPQHTGERVYMRPFYKANGLPFDLARWQPTVDAMLDGVDTDGPIYLMVDQGLVRAGVSHRRPGVHIDGYWNPAVRAHGGTGSHIGKSAHGGSGGGHIGSGNRNGGAHRGGGGHLGRSDAPTRDHHSGGGRHSAGVQDTWASATYEEHEGILLASSVTAARAYAGQFDGQPGMGGDCQHIDLSGLRNVAMQSGQVFAGNVTMLHESLPVHADCLRTVVRLNVPGWTPTI